MNLERKEIYILVIINLVEIFKMKLLDKKLLVLIIDKEVAFKNILYKSEFFSKIL